MKKIEEILVEDKEFFEAVFNGISDVLAIQLPDHTIVSYNRAGYEMLGKTEEQAQEAGSVIGL